MTRGKQTALQFNTNVSMSGPHNAQLYVLSYRAVGSTDMTYVTEEHSASIFEAPNISKHEHSYLCFLFHAGPFFASLFHCEDNMRLL
jgi:hypothetical protein